MISAGDFRNGITIELDNNVYQIIEFQHVKPGKGAAFVRTKLKNIKSGGNLRQKEKRKHVCDSITICWLNFKWAEILQFCKTSARFLKVK